MKTITDDVPALLPHIIADSVCAEVYGHVGVELDRSVSDMLADRADAVYAANPRWSKKVRSEADGGNAGRDFLYMFMRHWVSGHLKRVNPAAFDRLPYGFTLGQRCTPPVVSTCR